MTHADYPHPEKERTPRLSGPEVLRAEVERLAEQRDEPQAPDVTCPQCGCAVEVLKSRRSGLWFTYHSPGECKFGDSFFHTKSADRETAITDFKLAAETAIV